MLARHTEVSLSPPPGIYLLSPQIQPLLLSKCHLNSPFLYFHCFNLSFKSSQLFVPPEWLTYFWHLCHPSYYSHILKLKKSLPRIKKVKLHSTSYKVQDHLMLCQYSSPSFLQTDRHSHILSLPSFPLLIATMVYVLIAPVAGHAFCVSVLLHRHRNFFCLEFFCSGDQPSKFSFKVPSLQRL